MYRKHRPSLPRLVLRRGPMPHPHRIRPGKHHPSATLRHPTHQGSWTQCRRDPATTEQKCPLRLRLPQNDGQHTAKTPPLNPSLPSPGRPNQTAGSSPGPVPPELSPTPTDNPNPAGHPGINKRGPSTNLPCPFRHAQKRRNPSMMPTNPTHELICPAPTSRGACPDVVTIVSCARVRHGTGCEDL